MRYDIDILFLYMKNVEKCLCNQNDFNFDNNFLRLFSYIEAPVLLHEVK